MSSSSTQSTTLLLSVKEICRDLPLSDTAKGLASGGPTHLVYLEALLEKDCAKDAFLFMAGWLPRPEAVWWGCLCAWHVERPEPPPPIAATYQAVIGWLEQPSEQYRREADAAASAAPRDCLGAAVAKAVFYSEGSISLPGLPPVLPPHSLLAQVISNTVFLASRQGDSALTRQREVLFLRMGLEVLNRTNRW